MPTSPPVDRKLENMAEMTDRLGIRTIAAAWPSGVSGLVEAIKACQSCPAEDVCHDWLLRAPKHVQQVPPFCPNAAVFNIAKMGRWRRA